MQAVKGHRRCVYGISVELDVMTLRMLEQAIQATLRQFMYIYVVLMACDSSRFKFLQVYWIQDPLSGSYKFQICCHAGTQNLVPMSTGPVLLGRVTGLNVGDTSDTPKREGQTSPPCHVDIEASPSPTVTRVTHGDSQMERPSWTWRCLQMFIALLVVIFTTWLAIAIGCQESWDPPGCVACRIEVAALKDDPMFYCFDGEHWDSWFGSNVAVPHCTNCTHPLGSTFFVPQLGGRFGDGKLNRSCIGVANSMVGIEGLFVSLSFD